MLDEHRYRLLPVIRKTSSLRGVGVHAPYATTYRWGTCMRLLKSTAQTTRNCSLPRLSTRTYTQFSSNKSPTSSNSLHVIIADQAGFHLLADNARLPTSVRLFSTATLLPGTQPCGGIWPFAPGPHSETALLRNGSTATSDGWKITSS